jgi:pentatricopeptide repeat protein
MFKEGFSPNTFTFVCILRISTSMGCADKGKEIHSDITKLGLEQETLVANTLVYMYSKHGLSAAAWQVHSSLPIRDVVSWTALLAGCVERGRGQEAFHCFETMEHDAVSSNAVTLVCLLKVCGMARARAAGQEMHAEIVQKGLENDPFIQNTLIDMYAKCGSLNTAEDMFDKISVHDIVCWNVLLSGYVDNGCDEEVLICIEQLQHESIHPNIITYFCSLKACGNIGAAIKGQEVHSEIIKKGLDRDPVVGNSLIDMYAKCGLIIESKNMFDELEVRDQISWNALIAGFAQLGEIEEVSTFFNTMREEGIEPNLLTFLSILNTCSHAGLVEIGQIIFDAISNLYGFIRTVEHFTCMVDLLGRAGHIETALLMIRRMPLHPGIVAWHAVLGACRKWGDIEIGREAFDHAMGLDESSTAAHLCMINIFSDAATQKETRS